MLLGRSVFHSVVERLEAEHIPAATQEETCRAHRIAGLNLSFAANAAETETTRLRQVECAYDDIMQDRPEPAESSVVETMPPHLGILDIAAITAELDIREDTTIAELNEKRRSFALLNHPDRVSEAYRGNATVRMTIANHLIDQQIRKRQA